MSVGCGSYCEHGGICELPAGHEGLHDSKFCQWDDEHAISEEEADALMSGTPEGRIFLNVKSLVRTVFPGEPL